MSAAIFLVIVWLGIFGVSFSYPAPGEVSQVQQPSDLYIAEHPAKFSVWEVHTACMRLRSHS